MSLLALKVNNFRNLQSLDLEFSPICNLFYGNNGSGKSSLLEAIGCLGSGRSFRNHLISRIVQHTYTKFSLCGQVSQGELVFPVGIERSIDGASKIKIAGESVASVAGLAKVLPIQLITQSSFVFLSGGPKYKRKFIDWGVFHVEPAFFPAWQENARALKQRNSALKSNLPGNFIVPWDEQLSQTGQELHRLRKKYIGELLPIVNDLLPKLLDGYVIDINYYAGWNVELDLKSILVANLQRDYKSGFTSAGSHRADLYLTNYNVPVQDVLSRGQQKLFIFALYLAQGILLKKATNKQCVYLIDDLPAELDEKKRQAIIEILQGIGAQIFITGLAKEYFSGFTNIGDTKLFHVEQGEIAAEENKA